MIRFFWFFFMMLLAVHGTASAHRIGAPLVTLEWNQANNTWELTERLSAHDVEDLLREKQIAPDFIETMEGINWLGQLGLDQFPIIAEGGQIHFIGAEAVDGNVWIYFEIQELPAELFVDCNLLMDSGQAKMCLLNISKGQKTDSYLFQPQDGARSIRLP